MLTTALMGTMVGKTADALTGIKAVAPNCTVLFFTATHAQDKTKIQLPLKMSLMKQQEY